MIHKHPAINIIWAIPIKDENNKVSIHVVIWSVNKIDENIKNYSDIVWQIVDELEKSDNKKLEKNNDTKWYAWWISDEQLEFAIKNIVWEISLWNPFITTKDDKSTKSFINNINEKYAKKNWRK